ncbi:MAG: NAD(P)-dependent oxidoreductase [Alphaproteobacteria bacterium]
MADSRPAPDFSSALVTGATGFLGFHLAGRLADAGVAITVITRPSSDPARIAELPDNIKIHTATGDSADLIACLDRAKPDTVFHLAARFLGAHTPDDIAGLIEDNVTFTAQLCEAAVAAKCPALVAAGTGWQNAGSAPGDPTPAPNTLYAASKQAADDIIDYYCRQSDLNAVTLKIYDSYGPDDPRRKFLAVLRETATRGEALDATPGDQLLHMVHVDDLVDGFVHAGNLLATGEIRGRASHTLPSGQAVTLRELAELWMSTNDCRVEIDWGRRPHRDGEVMAPWEGTPLPGWTPRIGLKAGLKGC